MIEKEIKQLHDRATRGEELKPSELVVLQGWYDENDKIEDLLINQSDNESNLIHLNQQLSKVLEQIVQSATKVERLERQNDLLKQENKVLRRIVENNF